MCHIESMHHTILNALVCKHRHSTRHSTVFLEIMKATRAPHGSGSHLSVAIVFWPRLCCVNGVMIHPNHLKSNMRGTHWKATTALNAVYDGQQRQPFIKANRGK